MKEYETWEALKLLSENYNLIFLAVFNNKVGTLEMKFECGILKIRNNYGTIIDLDISTF